MQCKRGVKIINVTRGGVINETDLLEFLNQGHVGGVALDVFAEVHSHFFYAKSSVVFFFFYCLLYSLFDGGNNLL